MFVAILVDAHSVSYVCLCVPDITSIHGADASQATSAVCGSSRATAVNRRLMLTSCSACRSGRRCETFVCLFGGSDHVFDMVVIN
jgi:hypothetical protein